MSFQKIQEYISTADGSAGTLLIPKLIMPVLIEEVEKTLIPRELAAQVWGPTAIKGSSFTVDLETPRTLSIREVGEGAETPLDAISFETITYTPVKYGVAIRITREMIEDSQFELFQRNVATAGRRFAENETKLVLTALDGANTSVSGGASVTIANITTAMLNVEDQDYAPSDILCGNEIIYDLRNIDTFVEANKAGNTDMLNTGFQGTIYGLSVYRFTSSPSAVPDSTNSPKRAYVLDRRQTYGIAIKRDLTVENFNLPTYDMEGAVLTQRIDVQLLRSKAVSRITTS